MNRGILAVAALAGTMLAAAPASAQVRTVHFGVSGGPTIPVDHLADHAGTGFHGQFSMAFAPIMLPFGVRGDLLWTRFGADADTPGADNQTTLAGVVNAIIGLGGFGFRPYLSAGGGVYNTRNIPHGDETEETNFGLNLGGGFQFGLGGLNAFVEGRYHNLVGSEDARFVPISIGIMF
jgi:opacity protein-like surface antigen